MADRYRRTSAEIQREAEMRSEFLHGEASGKMVMLAMIGEWLRSPCRKPPELAFTAGPERELADEIEAAIQREKVEEEAGR